MGENGMTRRVSVLVLVSYLLGCSILPSIAWGEPALQPAQVIYAEPATPGEAAILAIMTSGTGNQTLEEAHCAHIVEHMVFLDRNAEQPSLTEQIATWGGVVGGLTAGDYTAFEITVPEQHLVDAIERLGAAMFDTEYDPELYARELNGYLRVELRQMTSGYPTALNHAFRQQMLQGTPYQEGLFSTDISTVPASRVSDWHRREYGTNRLILVISSVADRGTVLSAIDEAFDQRAVAPVATHEGVRLQPPKHAEVAIAGAEDNIYLMGLGVDNVSDGDRDDLALLFRLIQSQLRYLPIRELRGRDDLFLIDFQHSTGYLQTGFKLSDYIVEGRDPLAELDRHFADTVQRFATEGPGFGDIQLLLNSLGKNELSPRETSSLQQAWELVGRKLPGSYQADWNAYLQEDVRTLQQRLHTVASKYLPRAHVLYVDIKTAASSGLGSILSLLGALLLVIASLVLLIRMTARRNRSFKLFLSLLTVILKSTFRPGREAGSEEGRVRMRILQFYLAIILIIFALQFSALLVKACLAVGHPELVFILTATAAGSLLFFSGGYLLLSVFAWSKDTELLQALPLSAGHIVLARLAVVAVGQYPLVALFMVPPLLNYTAYMGGGLALWLTALLIVPLIPVLALTLVALPLILAMRYLTSKVRERLVVLGSLLLSVSMVLLRVQQSVSSRLPDIESLIMEQLRLRQMDLVNVMGRFFPPIIWIARALTNAGTWKGLLYIVLLVGASTLCLWALYFISQRYFVSSDSTTQAARTTGVKLPRARRDGSRVANPFRALLWREWVLLWRTPALLAATLPGMLAPLLVIYPLLHQTIRTQGVFMLAQILRESGSGTLLTSLVAAISAMMIVVYSQVAATSISREGSRFYFSKMMPVGYAVQLKAKLVHAALLGLICLAPFYLLYAWLIGPGITDFLATLLAGVLGLWISTNICVSYDLTDPRLDWDNAYTLMKKRSALVPVLSCLLIVSAAALLGAGLSSRGAPESLVYCLVAVAAAVLAWLTTRRLLRGAARAMDEIDT